MKKKFKYGKMSAVVFLTVLIWVWADLAKTEEFSVSGATITIAKSTDPALWVSFKNNQPSVTIKQVIFKGPASKIADARRQLNDGSLVLQFYLDAQRQAITGFGEHPLDVVSFLKQTDQIKVLGLTVISCQPEKIYVNVFGLTKKTLRIACVDKDRNPVKTKSIEPDKIQMLVPEDWQGQKLLATIKLTDAEIEQAKHTGLEKTPSIRLPDGQIRSAASAVKITISPETEGRLSDEIIKAPTLGIALSPTLQGKYNVEVINLNELITPISIKATDTAKQAYASQPFQMTLFILDEDKNTTEELKRAVVYNLPKEFVREDEIRLNQPVAIARFKLTAVQQQAP